MTDEIQNNKDLKDNNGFWVLVWDRLLDSIDVIVAKLTSGKFIATLLTVWTYCMAVFTCCDLVKQKLIEPATFLAVMAGVSGLVTMIVKDYFAKVDPTQETKVTETKITTEAKTP